MPNWLFCFLQKQLLKQLQQTLTLFLLNTWKLKKFFNKSVSQAINILRTKNYFKRKINMWLHFDIKKKKSSFPTDKCYIQTRAFPGALPWSTCLPVQETWGMGVPRSPGGGHGNPLQYPCLEKPTDRGAWWAMVHRLWRAGHDWSNSRACTHIQMIRITCHLCNIVYKSVNCSWLLGTALLLIGKSPMFSRRICNYWLLY